MRPGRRPLAESRDRNPLAGERHRGDPQRRGRDRRRRAPARRSRVLTRALGRGGVGDSSPLRPADRRAPALPFMFLAWISPADCQHPDVSGCRRMGSDTCASRHLLESARSNNDALALFRCVVCGGDGESCARGAYPRVESRPHEARRGDRLPPNRPGQHRSSAGWGLHLCADTLLGHSFATRGVTNRIRGARSGGLKNRKIDI